MSEMKGLGNDGLDTSKLSEPEPRYSLQELIGSGVYSDVHIAKDNETGKRVAVKILKYNADTKTEIEEEYKILRDLSTIPNLPDFYGVYLKKSNSPTQQDQLWFIMQLCEGGPVTDLVKGLIAQNKRMSEIHIAYILKETIKALCHLHENHVIHRDVKGSNILLTKEGEVKVVDFGISREVGSTLGKCYSSLGTPSYMAPEVVSGSTEKRPYDNRADVWALGITGIELADGISPYQAMHPTRALFQIVRNPPPTLYRPANWSQDFNDFVAECLEKNPEHRPFMNELIEHPFLTQLPENDFHLSRELKSLLESVNKNPSPEDKKPEFKVKTGMLKRKEGEKPEVMYLEDLAALEKVTEESVLKNLEHRFNKNQIYTFIGDVLICLNPHTSMDIYTPQHQVKYKLKSRSDNEPHIFSVSDAAYQDMLHHQADQHIVVSGETFSGKTTQCRMVLKQLLFLGQTSHKVGELVQKSYDILQAFGNAGSPSNGDSTRHILFTQVTFSGCGSTSGAIFWLYQLEKARVTHRNAQQANFHVFYYLFDSLVKAGTLDVYKLDASKQYIYLRRENIPDNVIKGPREDNKDNPNKLEKLVENLTALGFTPDDSNTIWKVLAAILLLGEIEFVLGDDGNASIKDNTLVDKVAELLDLDNKKLGWALTNYCVLDSDTVSRRKLTLPEANRARGALARNLYSRLVDWIVNTINQRLAISRIVFGDKHSVSILDYYGFECFTKNSLEQLFINTFNEQIQYYYNQNVFLAEMMDQLADEVDTCKLQFLDNKPTLDELLNKPQGVIYLLDEADKSRQDYQFVIDALNKKGEDSNRVEAVSEHNFTVAHYTGKVSYDSTAMVQKNKDFIPPEVTELMRMSKSGPVKTMFSQRLSRTGNVTAKAEETGKQPAKGKNKWGAALLAESTTVRRYNTLSRGEFSQTRGIRPLGTTYRATCIELMRHLSEGSPHFIRCIRTSLGQGLQPALVKQQLRALSLVDTANARKSGYPYRVEFGEFLRRYKFLAFDFDEPVDETKDNCRLLLVRLKLEGYVMGKNKIFLKYFNQEYLSRLYENQVKKIIKVQSMLRAFLAKRNVGKQRVIRENSKECSVPKVLVTHSMSEDEAALVIQKNIKGYVARKRYGPLLTSSGKLDKGTAAFIGKFAKRWRGKSLFQVLLWYRMARHMDMVYFFQQVHLYNVNLLAIVKLSDIGKVDLSQVRTDVDVRGYVGEVLPQVWRIPLNMKDLPFWDSSELCNKYPDLESNGGQDMWDEPFRKHYYKPGSDSPMRAKVSERRQENLSNFIGTPYCRDPVDTEKFYSNQPGIEVDIMTPKRRAPSRPPSRQEAGPSGVMNSPVRASPARGTPANYSPAKSPGKFVESHSFDGSPKPHSYTPVYNSNPSQFVRPQSTRDIVRTSSPTKSDPVDFRKQLKKPNGPDPIKELKQKGKSTGYSSDENENDEPPFNFQAMLRKTNYTRDSLKRVDKEYNDENDPSVVYQVKNRRKPEAPIAELNEDRSNNNNMTNNQVDNRTSDMRSKFKRQSSIEVIKAMMCATPPSYQSATDANRNPVQIQENGEIETKEKIELSPGVVLYAGDTIDL